MMLIADTLIVLGLSTISLGSIREADGPVERTFVLRNDGQNAICLTQGYTSCGCTTIAFERNSLIQPGDSTTVCLHFNPRGKSGEFYESGTITYVDAKQGSAQSPEKDTGANLKTTTTTKRKHCTVALEGTCISSEESMAQQFPIRATESLWLSANRFDLGLMRVGESKERGVVVLHRDEADRRELVSISLTIDANTPKGVQHIQQQLHIRHKGKNVDIPITFDVLVK